MGFKYMYTKELKAKTDLYEMVSCRLFVIQADLKRIIYGKIAKKCKFLQ